MRVRMSTTALTTIVGNAELGLRHKNNVKYANFVCKFPQPYDL